MFVRLALESDADAIVEMARINAEQTKQFTFSEGRVRAVIQGYLDDAHPTLFVVEKDRQAVAFLSAEIMAYDFTEGLFTVQKVLFVRPEFRGSRAAILLMKHLVGWSRDLGALEVLGGNDNGFQSERTARFLEHFGFKRVGIALAKDLTDGKQQEREQPGSQDGSPGRAGPPAEDPPGHAEH